MDKLHEESRKQFEGWLISTMRTNPTLDRSLYNPQRYVSLNTQHRWEAWQASRASIVAELPEKRRDDSESAYWEFMGIDLSADAIRSIGLSIKGE